MLGKFLIVMWVKSLALYFVISSSAVLLKKTFHIQIQDKYSLVLNFYGLTFFYF